MSFKHFGKWETEQCTTKENSEEARRQNSASDFVTGHMTLKLTKNFIFYVYTLLKLDETDQLASTPISFKI